MINFFFLWSRGRSFANHCDWVLFSDQREILANYLSKTKLICKMTRIVLLSFFHPLHLLFISFILSSLDTSTKNDLSSTWHREAMLLWAHHWNLLVHTFIQTSRYHYPPCPIPTSPLVGLCEFCQGEKLHHLPNCNHGFHLNCITPSPPQMSHSGAEAWGRRETPRGLVR